MSKQRRFGKYEVLFVLFGGSFVAFIAAGVPVIATHGTPVWGWMLISFGIISGVIAIYLGVKWWGSSEQEHNEVIVRRRSLVQALGEKLNEVDAKKKEIVESLGTLSWKEYNQRKPLVDFEKSQSPEHDMWTTLTNLYNNDICDPLLMETQDHDAKLQQMLREQDDLQKNIGDGALDEAISAYQKVQRVADTEKLYLLLFRTNVHLGPKEEQEIRDRVDKSSDTLHTLRGQVALQMENLSQGRDLTWWVWYRNKGKPVRRLAKG